MQGESSAARGSSPGRGRARPEQATRARATDRGSDRVRAHAARRPPVERLHRRRAAERADLGRIAPAVGHRCDGRAGSALPGCSDRELRRRSAHRAPSPRSPCVRALPPDAHQGGGCEPGAMADGHMSCQRTTAQMLARTMTVTRRLGWRDLERGELLQAVGRTRGLPKGTKVRKLGVIRVVGVRREPLSRLQQAGYGKLEAAKEAFPICPGASCSNASSRARAARGRRSSRGSSSSTRERHRRGGSRRTHERARSRRVSRARS